MSPAIDLVRSLYAAFAAGDVPAFAARLHSQVVWNEAEGYPLSDRNPYVGADAILGGVFARTFEMYDDFRVVVGEIVGGPEVVTMFGRYTGKCRASGKPLDVQCAHTWWITDGKIVRFQQMVDTASVARALA